MRHRIGHVRQTTIGQWRGIPGEFERAHGLNTFRAVLLASRHRQHQRVDDQIGDRKIDLQHMGDQTLKRDAHSLVGPHRDHPLSHRQRNQPRVVLLCQRRHGLQTFRPRIRRVDDRLRLGDNLARRLNGVQIRGVKHQRNVDHRLNRLHQPRQNLMPALLLRPNVQVNRIGTGLNLLQSRCLKELGILVLDRIFDSGRNNVNVLTDDIHAHSS